MSIYFYSSRETPYGCFSNFSAHGFTLDGYWWPTNEHYFQAQKFVGTAHADLIQQVKLPKDAARLGRQRTRPLRPDWEQVKDDVMRTGVCCKFETHADIREVLLATGQQTLVENAPSDYYWGCGQDGSGQNRLGVILMDVRDRLRESDLR